MRAWTPRSSTEFEDLTEVTKWHHPGVVFGAACWGSVVAGCGLVLAIVLGRDVPTAAFAIPGSIAALALLIRGASKEVPSGEKTQGNSTVEPRARPKEFRGT
jgi:hypothetical protein